MIYIINSLKEFESTRVLSNKYLMVNLLEADLSNLLSASKGQHALIMYQGPIALIADALRAEYSSAALIDLCIKQIQTVIQFFKKNRKHCTLVAIDATLNEAQSFDELCNSLSIELNIEALAQLAETNQDIYTLAATYLVSQSKALQKTMTELNACSAMPHDSAAIEITDTLADYRAEILAKEQALSDTQVQFKYKVDEYQVQTIALKTQFQVEKDQFQQDLAGQSATLATVQKDLANKVAEQQIATKAFSQQTEENELLIQHLHGVQETLETTLINLDDAKQAKKRQAEELAKLEKQSQANKAQAQADLKAKQAELLKLQMQLAESKAQFQQDLATKTAEQQTIVQNLTEQTAENESIIQQLHFVQEQLESTLIQLNNEQRENSAFKNEHKLLESTIDNGHTFQIWLRSQLKTAKNGFYKNSRVQRRLVKKQTELIKSTGLFDEQWYLKSYPDLTVSNQEPLVHYLLHGAGEGRNPSSEFNTLNYLIAYPDVADEGMNPLVHFIKFGQYEGRKPDPLQKRLAAPKPNEEGCN